MKLIQIYRHLFKPVFTILGIHSQLVQLFRYLRSRFTRSLTISVSGAEATFKVSSVEEYLRLDSLMDEEEILQKVLRDIQSCDNFYDIGANIGIYSCLVGTCDPSVSIVSFEPHPSNSERLQENIEINGLSERASVFEVALSDSEGETTLAAPDGSDELGEGSFSIGAVTDDAVAVSTISADKLIESENLPPPSVIKIDVEGAEGKVLRGMQDVLGQCRVVYCEVHEEKIQSFGDQPNTPRELLAQAGFMVTAVSRRGDNEVFLRAARK